MHLDLVAYGGYIYGHTWTLLLARSCKLGDWINGQLDPSCKIWDFEPQHVLTCFTRFCQDTKTWDMSYGNWMRPKETWTATFKCRQTGIYCIHLYKEKQKRCQIGRFGLHPILSVSKQFSKTPMT